MSMKKISLEVYKVIDTVIEKEKMIINDRAKMFLYQITNAAVQLTETEINNALQEVDCSAIEKINLQLLLMHID